MIRKKIIILNDTSISLHVGCELVINNLHKEIKKRGHNVNKTFPVSLSKSDMFRAKKAINKCDTVIINGEGTLHDGNGKYLLYLGSYAKRLGKEVHLINCVYQNNPKNFLKYIKQFDSILVRESKSQKDLESAGIQSAVAPDLTFITDTSKMHAAKSRKGVAFSDSVLPNVTKMLIKRYGDDKSHQYIPPFLKINYKNIRVVLKRKIYSNTTCKILMKFTLIKTRNLILLKRSKNIFTSPYQYINTLLLSEKVIAGRFHTVCLCVLAKTPFIAIESNSHKISGLLKDIGNMQNRIAKTGEFNEDFSVHEFDKNEIENIDKYLTYAKEQWKLFFDSL